MPNDVDYEKYGTDDDRDVIIESEGQEPSQED